MLNGQHSKIAINSSSFVLSDLIDLKNIVNLPIIEFKGKNIICALFLVFF